MSGLDLPYAPIRWQIYTGTELFKGFDSNVPESWAATTDFSIYRHYVKEGRSSPDNPFMGMMQSLHDSSITQGISNVISNRKVVAIMGGHKMARNSAPYRDVVILSRRLTRAGMLVCTGGGPGAMEAAHLGAALAQGDDKTLEAAIKALSQVPVVPALANIVASDGSVDLQLAAQAHAWFKPAHDLAQALSSGMMDSLAVPTWHYGHEPTTPFASQIAKYFQNSIREDGLLALAKQGIIYAEGKAGTIQEIFQDAAQNYYRTFSYFSPMILLGSQYWTQKLPVVDVLKSLFPTIDFQKYVLVTDDVDAAAQFVEQFVP